MLMLPCLTSTAAQSADCFDDASSARPLHGINRRPRLTEKKHKRAHDQHSEHQGSKHALDREVLSRYWGTSLAATRETLAEKRPLGESPMPLLARAPSEMEPAEDHKSQYREPHAAS